MFGLRKKSNRSHKHDDERTVFVDLSEVEVPDDKSEVRIKIIRPEISSDLDVTVKKVESGAMMIIDMEKYTEDKDAFLALVKAHANGCNSQLIKINTDSFLVSPQDTKVDVYRIRRR